MNSKDKDAKGKDKKEKSHTPGIPLPKVEGIGGRQSHQSDNKHSHLNQSPPE